MTEQLNAWLEEATVFLQRFGIEDLLNALLAMPYALAAVIAAFLVTLVAGRSFWLSLASLTCGLLILALLVPDPGIRELPMVLAFVAAACVLFSALGAYRRRRSTRTRFDRLAAERDDLAERLEDEIRWRRAAEDSAPGGNDRPPDRL